MPTCCVTGHRDIPAHRLAEVAAALAGEIDRAVADGYDAFFSGFAEGADLLFARLVAQKCRERPGLRLLAAVPYRRRFERLAANAETAALLAACAEVHVVSEGYSSGVFAARNRFMVDRSLRVIAVYDGRGRGGTAGTLAYARRLGREVRIVPLS